MSDANNPTITAICEADQNDRGDYLQSPTAEAWRMVNERDVARRKQVIALLHDGALHTADDYFHAGLVMVHGDAVDELILGHVFAMAAQSKGHYAAAWLSAITLDRMMQSLEQGQVFDTQPATKADNITLHKPVDKTIFLPQGLKTLFAAPPIEDGD